LWQAFWLHPGNRRAWPPVKFPASLVPVCSSFLGKMSAFPGPGVRRNWDSLSYFFRPLFTSGSRSANLNLGCRQPKPAHALPSIGKSNSSVTGVAFVLFRDGQRGRARRQRDVQACIRGESVRPIARRSGCTLKEVKQVLDRLPKRSSTTARASIRLPSRSPGSTSSTLCFTAALAGDVQCVALLGSYSPTDYDAAGDPPAEARGKAAVDKTEAVFD